MGRPSSSIVTPPVFPQGVSPCVCPATGPSRQDSSKNHQVWMGESGLGLAVRGVPVARDQLGNDAHAAVRTIE